MSVDFEQNVGPGVKEVFGAYVSPPRDSVSVGDPVPTLPLPVLRLKRMRC
jgi:hypothetical protein